MYIYTASIHMGSSMFKCSCDGVKLAIFYDGLHTVLDRMKICVFETVFTFAICGNILMWFPLIRLAINERYETETF